MLFMAKYSWSFDLTTTAANDMITVVTTTSGAGSVVGLYEIFAGGGAAASAISNVKINRSTGGTTPGSAQTLTKLHPASAAHTFFAYATWSAYPTLATLSALQLKFNAFAGVVRWVAPPDSSVIVGSQGAASQLSVREVTGSIPIAGHILLEEY